MSTRALHPYSVLIVEDELRDWAKPMKNALEDIAREKGFNGILKIDIAEDKHKAEVLLGMYNYHLTSLDMRLPEREGGIRCLDSGLSLARGFPWIGFPKLLIYSQLLCVKEFQDNPGNVMMILQVPTDLYAKPSGSDADKEQKAVELLTVKSWAERVAESLLSDNLELTVNPSYGKRYTIIGAYLNYGVNAIPPFLASQLQTLANHWTDKSSDRVEAATIFIEATARLAFAQSAVLCQAQGEVVELPCDNRIATCLNDLETLRKCLSGWNWCNYLTRETIQAFQNGRLARNDKAHSFESLDPQKRWASLRSPLQYAMDLATYWVRHPLALDLRSTRDGWSAELLAGTAKPRPRYPLPKSMDFPPQAVRSGVWQNVWRLPHEGKDAPERTAVSWENWLIPDKQTGTRWWFPEYQKDRRPFCIDLISGCKS